MRGGVASFLAMFRVPMWVGSAYAVLRANADPDLWGHVRFGLDLVRARHLPAYDPYSFTSDLSWVNHEWLAELFMGAAYAVVGPVGLILIKGVFTAATVALIISSAKRAPERWRWSSGFLAVLAIVPIAVTVRPQLWTMLLLMLLCKILVGAPRQRYWLPLIFVVWVNVHGGWLVGLGILWLWSFVEAVGPQNERPALSLAVGVPIACTLVTLGNPYGWHLWQVLASTVRLSRANIAEWQPIWRESLGSVVLWVASVVWVVMAVLVAEKRAAKTIAVVAMLAFAALRVNRLLPLFVPAAVILLLPYVSDVSVARPQTWPKGRLLVDVACACIGLLVLLWPPSSVGCIHMRGSWLPDVEAARALAGAHPAGRMVTWFDWGEYSIWHFGPAVRVSIDGRRETVYSEDVVRRQVAIAFGNDDGLTELERMSPEYVWLPIAQSSRTRDWLREHDYRIDVETPLSFVAVRRDVAMVRRAAIASAECFPGL
jgi:hypothetical protein